MVRLFQITVALTLMGCSGWLSPGGLQPLVSQYLGASTSGASISYDHELHPH